jgi:hypothetical protein
MLPIKSWKGFRLPELKWWAKAVFALYTLITIPVLFLLVVVMLKGMPRIPATAWESGHMQTASFATAASSGDALGIGGAAVNILSLGIPIVGIVLALITFARKGIGGVWGWGGATPARRAASVGILTAGTALLGVLWLPELPFGVTPPTPVQAYTRWEPIRPDERGTVSDSFSAFVPMGAAPTRSPTADPAVAGTPQGTPGTPTPDGTPGPAAAGAPTSGTAQATVVSGRTATRTPQPQQGTATAGAGTPTRTGATPTGEESDRGSGGRCAGDLRTRGQDGDARGRARHRDTGGRRGTGWHRNTRARGDAHDDDAGGPMTRRLMRMRPTIDSGRRSEAPRW